MEKKLFVIVLCIIFYSSSNLCLANQDALSISAKQAGSSVKDDIHHSVTHESLNGQPEHPVEYNLLFTTQQEKIIELESKFKAIDTSGGMNFAVWTGILLAAVAIILTALGVVMAIFSFLGYKKIMNSVHDIATSISENVAKEVARGIAEDLTPGVTESVLIKLFEEKRFDTVINQAVEKVIYRGIQLDNDNLLEGGIE